MLFLTCSQDRLTIYRLLAYAQLVSPPSTTPVGKQPSSGEDVRSERKLVKNCSKKLCKKKKVSKVTSSRGDWWKFFFWWFFLWFFFSDDSMKMQGRDKLCAKLTSAFLRKWCKLFFFIFPHVPIYVPIPRLLDRHAVASNLWCLVPHNGTTMVLWYHSFIHL